MGTVIIKHPVSDLVKSLIFDIRALWRSGATVGVKGLIRCAINRNETVETRSKAHIAAIKSDVALLNNCPILWWQV